MKINIAGDLVVSNEYNASRQIDEKLIMLFEEADYNIVNLEAPVTDSIKKIRKTGPHLKSNKASTLDVLRTLRIHLTTLANNHIKDYGEQGVLDTIDFCRENNINTVGAGGNLNDASRIHYIDQGDKRLAIINISENEWASANGNKAGANGMNFIKDFNKIQEAKANCRFVIVIVHGGHEYYNLPSPRMQELYRFYVDSGADLVVGHHTHCISGNELYKGVPIYYSLGNFLFTNHSDYEEWYYGMLLEIIIDDNKIRVEHHLIRQEKSTFKLRFLNDDEKEKIERQLEHYNSIISDPETILIEWNKYVREKKESYLNLWSPINFFENKYLRILLQKLNIHFLNKRSIALFLNLLRCEAHSDISKEVMNIYLNEEKNK